MGKHCKICGRFLDKNGNCHVVDFDHWLMYDEDGKRLSKAKTAEEFEKIEKEIEERDIQN